MSDCPAVYIMAGKRNGTLYIGSTRNLIARVWIHKNDLAEGFTKKYGVHRLVYFEQYRDMYSAMLRERRMKKWNRRWKIALIEKDNPEWECLYNSLL